MARPDSGRWVRWGLAMWPIVPVLPFALTAAAAANLVLGDVLMDRSSTANGIPAVVFPHWKHRSVFRCYACHPDVFEMRAGANDVTMDSMGRGEFCGQCHDGQVAFAVSFDTCRTCHSSVEP